MNRKLQLLLPVLAVGLLMAASTTAWAGTDLGLQLTSAPGQATICDNNINYPGCTGNASDLNPTLGAITFVGAVGAWNMNVTSGFGPPMENLIPLLDISTFNATTSTGAAPMTILLSVSGLTGLNGLYQAFESIGGTNTAIGATVTIQAWYSASNTAFCANAGCAVAISPLLSFTGASFNGNAFGSAFNPGNGPFAITLAVTINANGQADTTSFDAGVDLLPEPASLSLLGSGLLGFGMAFRRMLLRG